MFKEKIVSLFLSRINVDAFTDSVNSNVFLRWPYKLFVQNLIDFNFPQHLFLEATNVCNLKCEMCARNIKEQIYGYMDFNLFKKIIDEASIYGPRSFCLHIFGEPLLALNIVRMMEYIKLKNSNNTILLTTNGILLEEELPQRILDLGIDRLVVSVMAAKEETYEKITQADCLKKVETNIINFISLKKLKAKNKPTVFVRMLKNERTHNEVKLFIDRWSKLNVLIDIRGAHNYAGKIKDNIFKKVFKRYPCYHLWFSPGINYEGDVSICCCDWNGEAVIGNVKNQPLSNIWKNDLITDYRLCHLGGRYDKLPLCAKCDVWTRYPDIFFRWQKK